MTTNKIETDSKKGVLAIGLDPKLDAFVKRAAAKLGCSAAHLGRVATINAAAEALGETAPEVVESKKGPRGATSKPNPKAVEAGISNQELARRINALVAQGMSPSAIAKYDFKVDPKPVVHRAPKDQAPTV